MPRNGGRARALRNREELGLFRRHCPTLSHHIGIPFFEVRDALIHDPDLRQVLSILSLYITDDVRQLSFANMLPLFGYYFRGGHYPQGGSQALGRTRLPGASMKTAAESGCVPQ